LAVDRTNSSARWAGKFDLALSSLLCLGLAHLVGWFVPGGLLNHGIIPRRTAGLWGILFCPFLHVNLAHLLANTGALFVLLVLSLTLSKRLTAFAIAFIWLFGGLAVWLLGRSDTVYVGASGIVFGLIGFLLVSGAVQRSLRAFVLGTVVALLYGGALMTLLHTYPGVSWLAHAAGFASGMLGAWVRRPGGHPRQIQER
jgi:membrane associated rhomboid family serine protease